MTTKYYKSHYVTRYRLLIKFRKSRCNAWHNEIKNLIYEIESKFKEMPARSPRAHMRNLIAKIGDRGYPDRNCWNVLQNLLTEKEIVTDESLLYGRLLFNKLRC